MDSKKYILLYLLIIACAIFIQPTQAQVYGLKFQGDDFVLDKRTELDLTPGKFYKFKDEFEISFDYKAIRIKPNSNAGLFGYIFRIVDSKNNNIDLLSAPPIPQWGLNLVIGKSNRMIPVGYFEKFIDKWIRIRVKFSLKEDQLTVYTPDTFYVQNNIGFKSDESFKIIFGANDYKQFKSSDVPSMAIRDIKILENDKVKFHWPLNEKEGTVAVDKIKKERARVLNPSWLALVHHDWQKEFEEEIEGIVKVTSDNENGEIFMAGNEMLLVYSAQQNDVKRINYRNKPLFFDPSYRILFNSKDGKIYSYTVDEFPFYSLNINSGKWSDSGKPIGMQTKFRHHNSFYREKDNSIYTFGGYGWHQYSDRILQISLDSLKRKVLVEGNSIFKPRYLSGLGELNDTIYILGGYGSVSGNQVINPHSYFNLVAYTFQTGQVFEKFTIEKLLDDMVVGNRIFIDKQTRNYYALIFNKVRFENQLQLIKGSLDSPEVEMVGNKIPFNFIDNRSFIDLMYMPSQNKLYSYISYTSDSSTQVFLYSINYPPNNSEEINGFSKKSKDNFGSTFYNKYGLIVIILLSFLLVLLVVIIIWKRKSVLGKEEIEFKQKRSNLQAKGRITIQQHEGIKYDNNLIFFGGFQVFNKEFVDVTNKFPPMLKELFLLILLYTYKNNKGVSSEKIIETLWSDKSERSARNNLGVNIAKLRSILQEIGDCDISKKTGYWKISFSNNEIKSDYLDFLRITDSRENLKKEHIDYLIEITKKGAFLFNLEYQWLDEFKAMVSDRIVDTFVEFAQSIDVKSEADFIIHLADSVFNFDPVNEEAMILKCKAQYFKRQHGLAKTTYEKFCKEYKSMYNEDYEMSFHDITKG